MSSSCQEFLATATIKAASELEKAFLSLPEDKRNWKMSESTRSAADQVAECAIMNGSTIEMLQSQRFPDASARTHYEQEIARLSQDWDALQSLLKTNTVSVVEAIRAFPDDYAQCRNAESLEADGDDQNCLLPLLLTFRQS